MQDKYLSYVTDYLGRCRTTPDAPITDKMIIRLPEPYYSPNDAFFQHELYYWDTFFLLKYLHLRGGHDRDILSILNNFAWLIQTFGFIPNANRYDFLSRSQLPLFGLALYETGNLSRRMLKCLEQEMAWWQQYPHAKYTAFKKLSPGSYYRYFADYNEALAACESGWDYSPRWYAIDPDWVARERVSEMFPVDLNAVMVFNNLILKVHGYEFDHSVDKLVTYFRETFWCEKTGFYYDRDYSRGQLTFCRTLAGFMPLYFHLADQQQACRVAGHLPDFLYEDGLSTLPEKIGMDRTRFKYEKNLQWDFPNGWAPLHYFVAAGLINYGFGDEAREVMRAFVRGCEKHYDRYGAFPEKLVVAPGTNLSPAVYPLQWGFGWTNSVYGVFRLCLDGCMEADALGTTPLRTRCALAGRANGDGPDEGVERLLPSRPARD